MEKEEGGYPLPQIPPSAARRTANREIGVPRLGAPRSHLLLLRELYRHQEMRWNRATVHAGGGILGHADAFQRGLAQHDGAGNYVHVRDPSGGVDEGVDDYVAFDISRAGACRVGRW